jgi:hypothetical protein
MTTKRARRSVPVRLPEEINRAIYIDFEGTKKDPPSLLGWMCEEQWGFYVTEPAMYPAAHHPHEKGKGTGASLEEACRSILVRAQTEKRVLFAWSIHELTTILSLECWSTSERKDWSSALNNALVVGRTWARRDRVKIPEIEGHNGRPNKWSLSGFRIATDYPTVHALHEPGFTASRLRYVRHQLEKRNGDFSRLTPVAKGKWTKVLTHNFHDCAGMAHVMRKVYGLR